MLARAHAIIADYGAKGQRGIVHCISKKSMFATRDMFPKGEVLCMWSGTKDIDRERIKQAMNTGLPIENGAASVGGKQGVVTAVSRDFGGKAEGKYNIGVPKTVKVKFQDGEENTFAVQDVKSEVKAMAGTSVTSTGLNLQGTSYNVHLDLPDSAATKEQRDARNFRRGRTEAVNSHLLVPDLPSGRRKARQLVGQKKVMKGIDDPSAYETPNEYRDGVIRRHKAKEAAETGMMETADV